MADTVQAGSLLDAATWGGTVPTSGTGNVLHTCTGPSGTINCNINIGQGGSISVTGAFQIGGDLSTELASADAPVVDVGAGASLHVAGSATAANAQTEVNKGQDLILVHDGGSVTVDGHVNAGHGSSGSAGTSADVNGPGSGGTEGADGGIAISGGGSGNTINVGGNVVGGNGADGGNGGNGYADDTVFYAGGDGGNARNGNVAIFLGGSSTGTMHVFGSIVGGNAGSGGAGGAEGNWNDTNFGSGGDGGNGGLGGEAIRDSSPTGWLITIDGDSTAGNGGNGGSPGGGSHGGAGGAPGAYAGAGISTSKAGIGGDCTVGNQAGSPSPAYGITATADGTEIFGNAAGVSAPGKKVVCRGEISGGDNSCIFQLPTSIDADELLHFHPTNNMTFYATEIRCECSGRIIIVKKAGDTISQDGSTELVMMSLAAQAICVGVTIPITALDCNFPGENDVRDGVTYGESSEGNLVLPVVGDVRSGVEYGASGTEYAGTWDGSGGGFTGDDRTKLEAVWAKLPADHNLAGDNVTAVLESILTETRGQKIDRLDATISSRASAAHWTPTRGAYLDNLNVGGLVASQAEVVAVQNNTRCVRVVPPQLERPAQGSTAYRIELLLYDQTGGMEEPDSAPTIGVANQQGQTREANLDSTTMTLVSTGRYRSTYTVAGTHAAEELIVSFSVVEGGQTRVYANPALVVDSVAVDFTAGDRSQLAAIYQKLPGAAYLRGTAEPDGGFSAGDLSEIVAAVTPPDNASIAAIKAKTDLLPANPSARGDAMTLTAAERDAIADAVLSRDVSQVEAVAAEHSLCYTVLVMSESNTTAHAGKLTVYRSDGTTEFVQKTIASAGGAAAITGVS